MKYEELEIWNFETEHHLQHLGKNSLISKIWVSYVKIAGNTSMIFFPLQLTRSRAICCENMFWVNRKPRHIIDVGTHAPIHQERMTHHGKCPNDGKISESREPQCLKHVPGKGRDTFKQSLDCWAFHVCELMANLLWLKYPCGET